MNSRLPGIAHKIRLTAAHLGLRLERRGLTLADIALYAYTHVAPEGGFKRSSSSHVRAWLERVTSHPSHVPIDK